MRIGCIVVYRPYSCVQAIYVAVFRLHCCVEAVLLCIGYIVVYSVYSYVWAV